MLQFFFVVELGSITPIQLGEFPIIPDGLLKIVGCTLVVGKVMTIPLDTKPIMVRPHVEVFDGTNICVCVDMNNGDSVSWQVVRYILYLA